MLEITPGCMGTAAMLGLCFATEALHHSQRRQRWICGTGGQAAGEKDVLWLLQRRWIPLAVPNRETAIAVDNPHRRGAAERPAFPRLPLVLQLGAMDPTVFGNNPLVAGMSPSADVVNPVALGSAERRRLLTRVGELKTTNPARIHVMAQLSDACRALDFGVIPPCGPFECSSISGSIARLTRCHDQPLHAAPMH